MARLCPLSSVVVTPLLPPRLYCAVAGNMNAAVCFVAGGGGTKRVAVAVAVAVCVLWEYACATADSRPFPKLPRHIFKQQSRYTTRLFLTKTIL
jgi:hypothetical protein